MVCMGTANELPKLSERLVEFAGVLLDGSETGRNYIENTITMVATCWNIGAVPAKQAAKMRDKLSELGKDIPGGLPLEIEQRFDALITARRFFYGDDPRFIVSYDVSWTGPHDYYLQIASTILPEDERYSANLEGAGAGLSAELRERFEELKAPLTKAPLTEEEAKLEELIDHGFALLQEKSAMDESVAACEVWLEAWEMIKGLYQDKTSLDAIDNRIGFALSAWCSELDMHLINAASAEPSFAEKGITFLREFIEHFPESDEGTHRVYRRAIAELQFLTGACKEGDATFEALTMDFPDYTWGYIGWGDIYNPMFSRSFNVHVPADIDRAKKLYRIPIVRELEHANDARERLDKLLAYEREEITIIDA